MQPSSMPGGNIVVLAGGISSRMKQHSPNLLDADLKKDAETKSKAMIGVGEGKRPFLDYLLRNIFRAGYDDAVIVVNDRDTMIREYYLTSGATGKKKWFEGLKISFAVQTIPPQRNKPLGTADALLEALLSKPEWKGKNFTVCNSDNLYSVLA